MKGIFVEKAGETGIREIPKPIIDNNEVLIKVEYAGICGSDIHIYKGAHAFRKPPVILGHELTGTVVEIGKNVTRVDVGDKVSVLPQESCNKCKMCKEGHQQHCKDKKVPGTDNWIGTFVEYFNANEEVVYKLDDNIGLKAGVLAEPLAVAVHAVNKIPQNQRENLLILGGGAVGILALMAAKKMGFKKVIVTDIVDYNLEVAKNNKADRAVNVLREDLDQVVREEFGDEKASAVIVTAGASNILEQAIDNVGVTGTVIYIAMITKPLTFNTYPIVYKEINLVGSLTYNDKDFEEALDLINSDVSSFEKLITHCYEKEDVQEAFNMMEKQKEGFVKVVVKL